MIVILYKLVATTSDPNSERVVPMTEMQFLWERDRALMATPSEQALIERWANAPWLGREMMEDYVLEYLDAVYPIPSEPLHFEGLTTSNLVFPNRAPKGGKIRVYPQNKVAT